MAFFMWVVYILYSGTVDKYYVGRSENVDLRLEYHNNPIETRKFTARGIPWKLRLIIPCQSKAQAISLERLIKKKKSRKFIESLLENPRLVEKVVQDTST